MEQINNIISEADMLKGNICRICVTDSEKELAEMYQWASRRLANLFMWNLERFAMPGNRRNRRIRAWQQADVRRLIIRTNGTGTDAQSQKGACMFLYPDSKKCAEEYGEGPDAESDDEEERDV